MTVVLSEWTKLRSVRSTGWSVTAAGALIIGYAVLAALTVRLGSDEEMSASGAIVGGVFYLGQFAVVTLAALTITSEYATGAIRSTLQWVPSRTRMLLAKAAVLAVVSFVLGVVFSAVGIAVALPVIEGHGPSTSAGDAVLTVLSTGVFLALLSLFTLGVGTALRSTAGTITVVTLILLMVPMLIAGLGLEAVIHYFPGFAGVNAMVGDGVNPVTGGPVPYPHWAGLVVCAAWSGGALLLGHSVLRRRDA